MSKNFIERQASLESRLQQIDAYLASRLQKIDKRHQMLNEQMKKVQMDTKRILDQEAKHGIEVYCIPYNRHQSIVCV